MHTNFCYRFITKVFSKWPFVPKELAATTVVNYLEKNTFGMFEEKMTFAIQVGTYTKLSEVITEHNWVFCVHSFNIKKTFFSLILLIL